MYKRMLVPLDGSDLAEVVFPYAKELAGRLGIDITILHVSAPASGQYAPMHQAYIGRVTRIVKRQLQEAQKKMGIQPESKPVEVRGELVEGYPADEILRYAEENEVDLILMATRGHSGLKRWSIGSVAGKVLSASKIPVWLVQAGAPEETPYDKWPKITIIVPLDGSDLAEAVLPHVEVLAKQRGTESVDVVLLKVSETPTMPSYYGPELSGMTLNWGEYMQQEEVRRKKVAKEYLAKVEERLKNSNIGVRSEVLEGKATDEIVDYANKNPFSIIVMATHGRSGLSRLVYGSVAANVIHGVSRPIFLVKPQ